MALLSASPKWPMLPEYFHDWALVDVETSGLRPGRDRVLSLAVVTLDGHGRRTGEFSTLLNPGCDPGPVHVHGLTRARLAGAPTFEEIAPQVGALLSGRVLVAHNAQFDYDFLAHEFARVRSWVPVSRRLCTLALNRLIAPATPNLKLGTLAAHYGVRQERAHDAQDDVRVLTGILQGSLDAAGRLGLGLPLLACPPRQDYKPFVPRTPCPYRNPGRFQAEDCLVQGMKVAVTGETLMSREELIARSVAAGLNMMTSVSGQTSLLVTNDPGDGTAKLRRAVAEGVPLVDEQTYLRLLDDVRPGQAKGTAQVAVADRRRAADTPVPGNAAAATDAPAPKLPTQRTAAPVARTASARADRLLAGRRVLVLGGTHEEAGAARARAADLGASAAVNLSARVTDIVLLPGGESDRRFAYIYVDSCGTVRPAGPAPYLDCADAPDGVSADIACGLPWLADAEAKATSWIIANRLPTYLAEVQPRRLAELVRTRELVTKRLISEKERLLLDAAAASGKERRGEKPKESSASLHRKAAGLDVRLQERLALLDQQQSMSTKPPRILAAALVLSVAGPPSRK